MSRPGPAQPRPWACRRAERRAAHRRRCGRRHKLAGRYARLAAPKRSAADPLEWLLCDERRQLVRAALARLPRGDAEILLLKYTEGWTSRELADRLGVSPGAVEARLHRGRRRLRGELAGSNLIEVRE